MKKTPIIELLKWLFWTCLAAYGLGYVSILTLDLIIKVPEVAYNLIPFALVVLTFGIFYYRQLDRLDNILPLKEKRGLKATNARSIQVNGTHTMFLSQVRSIFAQNDDNSPNSVLYWIYGSHTIKEDYVLEWLKKGWRRQSNGVPHPYSGNWMTKQRFVTLGNQTIERQYHDATCLLLSDYQLWRKEPSQGTSGKALAPPLSSLEKLRGRW